MSWGNPNPPKVDSIAELFTPYPICPHDADMLRHSLDGISPCLCADSDTEPSKTPLQELLEKQ